MTAKLTSTGVTFGDGTSQTTALKSTGVSAGSYGSASAIPTLTINANGQITAAGTASVSVPANCSNCSSYTSLTNKPSIPANCANCSGDVNAGSGMIVSQCYQCWNCGEFQCGPASQCSYSNGSGYTNCNNYQVYLDGAGAQWTTTKSGTAVGNRGYKANAKKFNCNC